MQQTKFSYHLRTKHSKNHRKIKHSRGGATLFKDDFIRQVYLLTMLGARDVDVAEFFQVDVGTVDHWKKVRPEFTEALKRGKLGFDMQVVESLGKKALGYDYDEVHTVEKIGEDGKGYVITRKVTKHICADTTAIIFWLKNRQRHAWADVNRTEISADVKFNIHQKLDFSRLTEEEIKLVRNIAIKQIQPFHGVSAS